MKIQISILVFGHIKKWLASRFGVGVASDDRAHGGSAMVHRCSLGAA